jgi:hypothetical protein
MTHCNFQLEISQNFLYLLHTRSVKFDTNMRDVTLNYSLPPNCTHTVFKLFSKFYTHSWQRVTRNSNLALPGTKTSASAGSIFLFVISLHNYLRKYPEIPVFSSFLFSLSFLSITQITLEMPPKYLFFTRYR